MLSEEKIIVIEDEEAIQKLIVFNLEKAGFSCLSVERAEDALKLLQSERCQLIVLDIMLPGMDGLEFCRRLREQKETVPVIMLTARGEEIDRVLGLEIGADDYLTKPFSPRELIARVKAVLRRVRREGESPATTLHTSADITIDYERYQVFYAGTKLDLTTKEFKLLDVLIRHPGRVFGRDYLLEHLWDYDFCGDTRVVDVHISHLREKLSLAGGKNLIKTVYGIGYRFEEKKDAGN